MGINTLQNKWMCNDCPRDLVWLMAVRTAPLVGLLMSKYQLPTAQSIIKITTSAWSVSSWKYLGAEKKLGDPIQEVIWVDFTVPDKTNV